MTAGTYTANSKILTLSPALFPLGPVPSPSVHSRYDDVDKISGCTAWQARAAGKASRDRGISTPSPRILRTLQAEWRAGCQI